VEVCVGLAGEFGDELGGAVGGVIGTMGDEVRSGAVDLDDRIWSAVQAYPHRQRQREAYRIVSRAQVR
jgi:hypothetical protein